MKLTRLMLPVLVLAALGTGCGSDTATGDSSSTAGPCPTVPS